MSEGSFKKRFISIRSSGTRQISSCKEKKIILNRLTDLSQTLDKWQIRFLEERFVFQERKKYRLFIDSFWELISGWSKKMYQRYPRIFLKQILTTKFLLTFFSSFLEIRNFDTTIDHYCDYKVHNFEW